MEASKEDLSEGELVDEEGDNADEPQSKKRKMQLNEVEDGGGWEKPSKKHLKKKGGKFKHKEREKKQMESKRASGGFTKSKDGFLHACQTDLLCDLAELASGNIKEDARKMLPQNIKTAMFKELVSTLTVGTPVPVYSIPNLQELRDEHKVLVVWLSTVSAKYYKLSDSHFPRIKKLHPTVNFEILHPGNNKFVKLGLEAFMMSSSDGDDHARNNGSEKGNATESSERVPPRSAYLFSLKELTANEFPNPSDGEVDQMGRCVSDYVSVRDWPDCDIKHLPEVVAASAEESEGDSKMPLFAVDCEMVNTQNGSELARVSIVNEELECIYDRFVKPEGVVLDYLTKYSGVTEEILKDVTTSLTDVQEKLLEILPPNSILVGHSLENDFHTMRFRHPFVIDTSCLFTPFATPTCKPALRRLSRELLVTDIQNSENGHSSVEDAETCMKLVQLKLKGGASCKIAFNEITPSLFTDLQSQGITTGIVDKESVIRLFGRGSSHQVDAKTDEEAVEKVKEVVALSKFTFVQLHGMEYLLKSESDLTGEKQLEQAEVLDRQVVSLVEDCPSKTVVFVVFGSGDIRKVRNLQQQSFADYNHLKKEVMSARTGHVVSFVVS